MSQSKEPFGERPAFAQGVSLKRMGQVDRPFPNTWGPPPLNSFLFEDQQLNVLSHVEWLALNKAPSDLPHEIKGRMWWNVGSRFVGRMIANYDNLAAARNIDARLSPTERSMAELGLAGVWNPAEATYISEVLQMRGVAVGAISAPYGEGLYENLVPMHDAMEDTARIFGAEEIHDEPVFKIKEYYADTTEDGEPVHSALITRKAGHYVLAGTISFFERGSILLRLDAKSAVDRDVKHAIMMKIKAGRMHEPMTRADDIGAHIYNLYDGDAFDTAMPQSSTLVKANLAIPHPPQPLYTGDDWSNPRKTAPNLTLAMTRTQLEMAGIPMTFSEARKLPLSQLIARSLVGREPLLEEDDED